jgi:hypothetical protein
LIDFSAARGPKLSLDESSVLDIGSCVVDGHDLAPGTAVPDDGDARISHSVQGFLFTCGPDHIRHPSPMGAAFPDRRYPLHGSFSSNPAQVLWTRFEGGNAECRAEVDLITAEGRSARLERHWAIDGVTGEVHLRDRVVNTGSEPMPAFFMYHMNIGGKWLDGHTQLRGRMLEGGGFPFTFGEADGGIFCVPARTGEDRWAEVSLGPIAAIGNRTLRVRFAADTLPFLQMWRNQRLPVDVVGIEPVSHRWEPREVLEQAGEFNILQPGEGRDFALSFAFVEQG